MTNTFWHIIEIQIEKLAEEWLKQYGKHLLTIRLNKPLWWQEAPFNTATIEYEHAELSFVGWMNAIEIIMGRPLNDIFEETLKLKVKDAIEYQHMKVRDVA